MANATSGLALGAPDLLNTRGAAPTTGTSRLSASTYIVPFFNTAAGYHGVYKVAGTTTDSGSPAKHRVYLFAQPGMVLVRSADTELPAATFEFTNIAAGLYLVVGFDTSGTHNAVVYSHVAAVPM